MSVRNARIEFQMDRGSSRVLDDVDFDIERENIIGVVGESGSGKSMFASALLDAVVEPGVLSGDISYFPDDGDPVEILELSQDELRQVRWEEIAMVFQGAMSSFNPTMNIGSHFKETIQSHGYDVSQYMEMARDLLSDVYLEPDRVFNSYPHELSGGMKQRALIALSLALEPDVIIMDEPTASLDLLMQQSILRLLDNLQEKYDLTVLFITHDLPLVANIADTLAVMYAFEFVETGPAEDIINDPTHPYTRALLRSVPNLSMPLGALEPIEGSAPDPVNIPSGCSYHPRCPLADGTCENEDPERRSIQDDRTVACHHWEQSAEAIPLETEFDQAEEVTTEDSAKLESVVEMEDVSVHFEQSGGGILEDIFSDPELVHAVDGVDLEIYENDVVALVGESGCGKTTLGKVSIGVQRPTDGNVSYRGQDIWDAKSSTGNVEIPFREIRQSLQIIHQDPGSSLNPNVQVRSILSEPLKRIYPNITQSERFTHIHSMLEYVGMTPPEDYARRYPHQLSGGEQQRVALIRAILTNPDLILADEAVSALDVSLRVEMMDLFLDLQEEVNTSYLFISHNLSNARYLAEKANGRIGVMYLGEIVEIGPAEEILQNPQHPYTQVLKWSTPDLELEEVREEAPIRGIDIPDPVDPPSGCRFHTRCPEAREVCREQSPELQSEEGVAEHHTSCFRSYDSDHPYWDSEPLVDEQESESEAAD